MQPLHNAIRRFFFLLILFFLAVLMAPAAQAANHALLIGVGQYPYLPVKYHLQGPSNDVRALSRVLQIHHGFKAAHIRTLVDEEATRTAILSALADLGQTTRPGDFIFIYFSGHGTSSYDPSKKEWGIDPYTGAIIPADFKIEPYVAAMMANLIIGKRDLRPILKELEKEHLVFVAVDACYSGDTVRSLEKRCYRYLPLADDNLFADETPAPYSSGIVPEPSYPYTNVIYLAAASRRQKAEDIPEEMIGLGGYETIDGKPHGAMTDALLRALNGAGADTNGNGGVTANELYHYVKNRTAANFSQTPQQLAPDDHPVLNNRALFNVPGAGATTATTTTTEGPLRVQLGSGCEALGQDLAAIPNLKVVKKTHDIKVVQTANGYDLYLASGALLATVPQKDPQAVVARLRRQVQVRKLAAFTYPHQKFNVFIDLIGNKGVLIQDEIIGFTLRTDKDAYILLVNIDAAGNINVIYPYYKNELEPLPGGVEKRWEQIGKVAPPWFGTEYLKVFAFEKQPESLKDFVGAEFAPDDPLLDAMMQMIKKQAGQAAQMTLQVNTRRKTDMEKIAK